MLRTDAVWMPTLDVSGAMLEECEKFFQTQCSLVKRRSGDQTTTKKTDESHTKFGFCMAKRSACQLMIALNALRHLSKSVHIFFGSFEN